MLTDDLYTRLNGSDVQTRAAHAILVCTVDADGLPHPAMLSYYEVAAIDRGNLRLAVYTNSRTCGNMRARGKATLVVVDERLVCYITGMVEELAPAMRAAPYNAKLNLRIDDVRLDQPREDLEPDTYVTGGITFRPRTGPALTKAQAILTELLEP